MVSSTATASNVGKYSFHFSTRRLVADAHDDAHDDDHDDDHDDAHDDGHHDAHDDGHDCDDSTMCAADAGVGSADSVVDSVAISVADSVANSVADSDVGTGEEDKAGSAARNRRKRNPSFIFQYGRSPNCILRKNKIEKWSVIFPATALSAAASAAAASAATALTPLNVVERRGL